MHTTGARYSSAPSATFASSASTMRMALVVALLFVITLAISQPSPVESSKPPQICSTISGKTPDSPCERTVHIGESVDIQCVRLHKYTPPDMGTQGGYLCIAPVGSDGICHAAASIKYTISAKVFRPNDHVIRYTLNSPRSRTFGRIWKLYGRCADESGSGEALYFGITFIPHKPKPEPRRPYVCSSSRVEDVAGVNEPCGTYAYLKETVYIDCKLTSHEFSPPGFENSSLPDAGFCPTKFPDAFAQCKEPVPWTNIGVTSRVSHTGMIVLTAPEKAPDMFTSPVTAYGKCKADWGSLQLFPAVTFFPYPRPEMPLDRVIERCDPSDGKYAIEPCRIDIYSGETGLINCDSYAFNEPEDLTFLNAYGEPIGSFCASPLPDVEALCLRMVPWNRDYGTIIWPNNDYFTITNPKRVSPLFNSSFTAYARCSTYLGEGSLFFEVTLHPFERDSQATSTTPSATTTTATSGTTITTTTTTAINMTSLISTTPTSASTTPTSASTTPTSASTTPSISAVTPDITGASSSTFKSPDSETSTASSSSAAASSAATNIPAASRVEGVGPVSGQMKATIAPAITGTNSEDMKSSAQVLLSTMVSFFVAATVSCLTAL